MDERDTFSKAIRIRVLPGEVTLRVYPRQLLCRALSTALDTGCGTDDELSPTTVRGKFRPRFKKKTVSTTLKIKSQTRLKKVFHVLS